MLSAQSVLGNDSFTTHKTNILGMEPISFWPITILGIGTLFLY